MSITYSPAPAETAEDRRAAAGAARRSLQLSCDAVVDRAARAGVEVEHALREGRAPSRTLAERA